MPVLKSGIMLTAYFPLCKYKKDDKDSLLKNKLVTDLAKKYKKNAGQILLKFQVSDPQLSYVSLLHYFPHL